MSAQDTLKLIAKAGKTPRDRLLILIGAYTGMKSDELSHLTAGETQTLTQSDLKPIRKLIQRYVKSRELADDDLMFRSQTYGGKLERTAIYRIISNAVKRALGMSRRGGIRLLQALWRVLCDGFPRWIVDAVLTTGYLPEFRSIDLDDIEDWPAYYNLILA